MVVIRKLITEKRDALPEQRHKKLSCDSSSVGFGGRVNLNKALSSDIAYFSTHL